MLLYQTLLAPLIKFFITHTTTNKNNNTVADFFCCRLICAIIFGRRAASFLIKAGATPRQHHHVHFVLAARMWLLLTLVLATKIHHTLPSTCRHASEILHVVNSTESECLRESEVDGVVFPKCCPLHFVYDTETHTCKKSEIQQYQEKFFKIGLRSCVLDAVIVDFVTDLENFERNEENGTAMLKMNETTVSLEKGKFCVDEHYKSNLSIVVRVCSAEKLKECGKSRKCLRKCCPDLEIFNERKMCTPLIEQPLDYNNWGKTSKITAGNQPLAKTPPPYVFFF